MWSSLELEVEVELPWFSLLHQIRLNDISVAQVFEIRTGMVESGDQNDTSRTWMMGDLLA